MLLFDYMHFDIISIIKQTKKANTEIKLNKNDAIFKCYRLAQILFYSSDIEIKTLRFAWVPNTATIQYP